MKKITKSFLFIVILLGLIIAVYGCIGVFGVKGSGNIVTKKLNPSPENFEGVKISRAINYEIIQADEYSVSVAADDNMFEYIVVEKVDGVLNIELDKNHSYRSYEVKVEVSMPKLVYIKVSEASAGNISGFDGGDELKVKLSGSSKLDGDIIVDGNAIYELSGSSEVILSGSTNDIVVKVEGSSVLNLYEKPSNDAFFEISGSSIVTLNVNGKLEGEISGSSVLNYTGDAQLGNIDVYGSSELNHID